jgi:polyisoprenoid-binding protein YceI
MRLSMLGLIAAIAFAATGASAAPAAWTVDKAKSKLGFRGTIEGEAFDGVFRRWDAVIKFDPKDLAHSSASVSIDTGSGFTNNPDRDESLPTQDWFAAKTFPKASFVAKRFVDQGGGRYQAIGELTIKGVKKPLVLPFTLALSGPSAKMTASLVLDRTAFGIGSGRWKSEDMVASKVTVSVNLIAAKAP